MSYYNTVSYEKFVLGGNKQKGKRKKERKRKEGE
jgi:hypothetical protein